MNRLRRLSLPLLATVCLAGLPACGGDDVEREAGKEAEKAGEKAKTAGEKAKTAAEKAKKDAEKAKEDVDGK